MKISIDGGGICVPPHKRYGNYIYTVNLIRALTSYDKGNTYYVYSFCSRPNALSLNSNSFYKILKPKLLWMKLRVSIEELLVPKDVFIAVNQAMPVLTRSDVISVSHGLSFMYFPAYYKDSFRKMSRQLDAMVRHSRHIVVSSQRVKQELTERYPTADKKTVVIPYGIPYDMTERKDRVRQNYFVFAGMNNQVKNVKGLVDAFLKLIEKKEYKSYKLYLVGPFAAYKKKSRQIQTFPQLPREEYREMLRKARAYVCASHYESFNIPALEALSQGCPVVAVDTAIIPEMRKYVLLAHNEDELVSRMEEVAAGKTTVVKGEELDKAFNWETYVKKLLTLYKKK